MKSNYNFLKSLTLMLSLFSISLFAQVPTNDLCANAITISCGSTTAGTNVNATNTGAPTTSCITTPGSKGVWYRFVGNGDTVTASTCGAASFDTKINVYSGSCGTLTCVTGNDDTTGCAGFTSRVVFNSVPGTIYYVYVSGFGSAAGTFTLSVSCATPTPPPANDNCQAAIALTVNPDYGCSSIVAGTTVGATASPQVDDVVGTPNNDVWYSFVATATAHRISLTNVINQGGGTSTSVDMAMGLYNGNGGCNALVRVGDSDPDIYNATGLVVGTTYFIRVYGYFNETQNNNFNICVGTLPSPPSNDNCEGAITLTVNPDLNCGVVRAGTTLSATASPQIDDVVGTPNNDVWYSFIATGSRHQISLLNVVNLGGGTSTSTDMAMGLYRGGSGCSSLVLFGDSDPNTYNAYGLSPGVRYYVRVYGYSTLIQHNNFNICVGTIPPPPANDTCANDIQLGCASTYSGDTTWANSESLLCNNNTLNTAPGVWFSFEGTGGRMIVTTADSSFDTKIGIFTGDCGVLSCIGYDDDSGPGLTSELTVTTTMGTRYYVYLTGFSTARGIYNITINCICEVNITTDCKTVFAGYQPAASTQLSAVGRFGLAPYSYLWSDGQTGGTITVAPTETTEYTVTVTDAAGCTSTDSTVVVVVDAVCGQNFDKVVICHRENNGTFNELCVSPNAVQAHLNHGDSIGTCNKVTCATLPLCDSQLKVPAPNATNVSIDVVLAWSAATGYVQGYYLSIGTNQAANNILNMVDVGNVLTYDPNLNYQTQYYVKVVPYNNIGTGTGCGISSFTTQMSPWCMSLTNISCSQTITGNTASGQVNNLASCTTTLNTARGVWYRFIGNGNRITASLCNSSFDTKIGVFQGTCSAITCVAGNNDFSACGTRSQVEFTAAMNVEYFIYVTGNSTNTGDYSLSLTCVDPTPPQCASAEFISCGASVIGTTVGYPTANLLGTCVTTVNTAPGRFYKMIGTGTSVTVSTCHPGVTLYDTKLAVFSGACNNLVCVSGNDDGSDPSCILPEVNATSNRGSIVTFNSLLGQQYYIYVTGFLTNAGQYQLSVSCAGARVAEMEANPMAWDMYPNPATNGEVQLDLTNFVDSSVGIQLMDFTGKVIINNSESRLQNPIYKLGVQNMTNGMYFVRIVTDAGVSTKKLIIAN